MRLFSRRTQPKSDQTDVEALFKPRRRLRPARQPKQTVAKQASEEFTLRLIHESRRKR